MLSQAGVAVEENSPGKTSRLDSEVPSPPVGLPHMLESAYDSPSGRTRNGVDSTGTPTSAPKGRSTTRKKGWDENTGEQPRGRASRSSTRARRVSNKPDPE